MDLSGMLSELDGPVVRFVSPVSYGNALAVVGGELDLNGSSPHSRGDHSDRVAGRHEVGPRHPGGHLLHRRDDVDRE